jgi:hypothetical protein
MSRFTGVFTVAPYFEVRTVGMAMRGGGLRFEVRSNDPDFAFGAATGVSVAVDPVPMDGRITTSVATTPRLLTVDVAASLTATLARYTLTLSFAGRQLALPGFDLADKVELPLTDVAPLTAITLEPREKKLIRYTGAATPVEATLHISAGLAATNVRLVLLDVNGEPVATSGSSGLPEPGNDLVLTADVNGTYLLLEETAGTRTTNITVTAVNTSTGEVEPNDDAMSAQLLTLEPMGPDRGVRVAASSTGSSDLDWYKLTITAADVGKRIHVRIFALAYVWYDTELLSPSGSMFATSDTGSSNDTKSTDYYSPPITAEGEYTIGLDPDTSGDYHFTLSLQ